VARWGGLDILVNNAGLFLGKGIEEASLDEWHWLCAVNPAPDPPVSLLTGQGSAPGHLSMTNSLAAAIGGCPAA
jgi:NAD(P)-dependent dehydrogenase (short-subunit alcohol dehydrogenase family)